MIGTAGVAADSTSSPSPSASGASGWGGGGASSTAAPSGPARVTLVNGVIDRPSLYVCANVALDGAAVPFPAGGIPYAAPFSLEADWDLREGTMDLTFFAGKPEDLEGRACADLASELTVPVGFPESVDVERSADAGRPAASPLDASAPAAPPAEATSPDASPLDAAVSGLVADAASPDATVPEPPSFPVRPALAGRLSLGGGVLSPAGDYALVVAGCADPGDLLENSLCGPSVPVLGGRLSMALVALTAPPPPDGPGLQFLNASRALQDAQVSLQLAHGGGRTTLASDVDFGGLRPRNAAPLVSLAGVELTGSRVSTTFVREWSSLQPEAADPDQVSVLCYVGPRPTGSPVVAAQAPSFVLVPGARRR